MKQNFLLAALLLTSCLSKPDAPKCELSDYYLGKNVTVAPIITTSCDEAKAIPTKLTKDYFSLEQFPLRLTVNQGGARFRRSPEFNASDPSNVLGFLAEKNEIYAVGPSKNEYGIYYAIPVLDVNNDWCLAYVSTAVVSEKQTIIKNDKP